MAITMSTNCIHFLPLKAREFGGKLLLKTALTLRRSQKLENSESKYQHFLIKKFLKCLYFDITLKFSLLLKKKKSDSMNTPYLYPVKCLRPFR